MKRRSAGVLWDMRAHVRTVTFTARGTMWFGARTHTILMSQSRIIFNPMEIFFKTDTPRVLFFPLSLRRLTPSISKTGLNRGRNCGKNKWELVEEDTTWLCAIWTGKTAKNRDWRRKLQKVSTLRYLEIASGIAVSREEKRIRMSAKEEERKEDERANGGWKNSLRGSFTGR